MTSTTTTTANGTAVTLERDNDLIGITVAGTDSAEGQTELQLSVDSLRELLESGALERLLGTN
ncbi:hypothetical protein I1A62_13545 [Rhodococcus sp. USK10]|uniref:hypothetical protein n=1 Tax=Rhodococcus sp. USK10 TaxID=2789739 RepID=UPI001C5D2FE9|nr:hypothetical protein [Rhodococcus sp. USK10]QYB05404.1 hypothetical protein I1A62_13545 [Rhodococcus sp. USK10]